MNHSNTALWTNPKFDYGDFFINFVEKFHKIYLHFQIVQTLIRGLLQEPSDLGLDYLKKNIMDSLQWATGLKGFKATYFILLLLLAFLDWCFIPGPGSCLLLPSLLHLHLFRLRFFFFLLFLTGGCFTLNLRGGRRRRF